MQYFVSYLNISIWLATKNRKKFEEQTWIENCECFVSYLLSWESGTKLSDVLAADWQSNMYKVIANLHRHLQLFLSWGLEIVVKISSLYDKTFFPIILENSECHWIVSFFYVRQTRECPVNEFCNRRQSMYRRSHQL